MLCARVVASDVSAAALFVLCAYTASMSVIVNGVVTLAAVQDTLYLFRWLLLLLILRAVTADIN